MASIFQSLGAYARGFKTTLGYLLRKPVTQQYPEYKPPVQTRFRGRHLLMRYENGLERCIGCSLCAIFCPAQAIYVEAAENTDEARFSPGERYAKRYEINMLRCIYCGYCQEACPTEAIVLGHEYAFSDYSREALIYTKDMLLVTDSHQAAPKQVAAVGD
jgi:NADH-quinone oxidoreductase subunit I